MYEETTLDDAPEGELTVVPRFSAAKSKNENIRYAVSDVAISNDNYGRLKALGRVENTTEEDEGMVYIIIVLKDSTGAVNGLIFTILPDTLAARDKIGFEASGLSLPPDVTAESVASFEAFAYPLQLQI